MICCGIPASFGQQHFFVNNEKFKPECLKLVYGEMEKYAGEVNSSLLLWKEFNPSENVFPHLQEKNYIALPTLPDNRIIFDTNNRFNFLDNLRSSYRRKFRGLEGFLDQHEPTWRFNDLQLEDTEFDTASVEEFYDGYIKLMNRTSVKLEVYSKEFFIELTIQKVLEVRLLTFTNLKTGEKLMALIVPNHHT
jgi:hypothetical protein